MNSLLTVNILDITVFNTKTFVVKLAYKHKTGDFVHLVQIVRFLGGLGKFLRYPKFTKTRQKSYLDKSIKVIIMQTNKTKIFWKRMKMLFSLVIGIG